MREGGGGKTLGKGKNPRRGQNTFFFSSFSRMEMRGRKRNQHFYVLRGETRSSIIENITANIKYSFAINACGRNAQI
jgi:hypothetical protein